MEASGLANVLATECGISPAWQPTQGGSAPSHETFDAIWDTGATNSVITQGVVDKCGLAATGIAQVHGVHGTKQVETYLVNIRLPNSVIFTNVRVTRGEIPSADVLVGMDIINSGDFSVTNSNGITKFSYRTPSIEHIDYVAEAKRVRQAAGQPNRAQRRRANKGRP